MALASLPVLHPAFSSAKTSFIPSISSSTRRPRGLGVEIEPDTQGFAHHIVGVMLHGVGERAVELGGERDAVGDGEARVLAGVLHEAHEIARPSLFLKERIDGGVEHDEALAFRDRLGRDAFAGDEAHLEIGFVEHDAGDLDTPILALRPNALPWRPAALP